MRTYVLIVSRIFPKTHKRAGENTEFTDKIACSLFCTGYCSDCDYHKTKIHTIRANYELWEKRIKDVQDGKAVISIRYWSGKPYNSKQIKLHELDKDSGVGVQKIRFPFPNLHCFLIGDIEHQDMSLSKNDGLSYDDFKEWFKKYDLSKPMAIIQFTDFRY